MAAVLVYDADCPVCRAAADWVRRNALDPDTFEFLPCRSAETRSRFPAIAEAACLQAMHLVLPDGTILDGERALPEILPAIPMSWYAKTTALMTISLREACGS